MATRVVYTVSLLFISVCYYRLMSFALKCVCYLQPLFSWMDFIKPAKDDHKPFL